MDRDLIKKIVNKIKDKKWIFIKREFIYRWHYYFESGNNKLKICSGFNFIGDECIEKVELNGIELQNLYGLYKFANILIDNYKIKEMNEIFND